MGAARWGWLLLVGCGEPDPEPPGDPCGWEDAAEIEAGTDIAATGLLQDGVDVPYGRPPQSGAPYAPFQVRVHAPPPTEAGERWLVHGEATDAADGAPLGDITQPQAFICSNTGVHEGWLYGGEVHIRFWGMALEDLVDREVSIRLWTELPDGQVPEVEAMGTLRWRLGPGAPG